MTAKLAEMNAKLALGGDVLAGGAAGAASGGGKNLDQWIAFHEPKINMH